MLTVMYQRAGEVRDSLRRRIGEIGRERADASRFWRPLEIAEGPVEGAIAGVDGSQNHRQYMDFILFAVGAECVIFDGERIRTIEEGMIDLLSPYRFARDRLDLYQAMIEMKLALSGMRGGGVERMLIDGSLIGHILRPLPFEYWIGEELRSELAGEFVPRLRTELGAGRVEISAFRFAGELRERYPEHFAEGASYLEYLEKLLVLRELLEGHGEGMVGISKTSTRNEYFGEGTPDLAIFQMSTRGTGYSDPIELRIQPEAKRRFPLSEEFFRSIAFRACYARLSQRGNVLRFEFPRSWSDREIERFFGTLSGVSAGGYPYLLRKAHRDVEITGRDMERISHYFGISGRTGREML